MNENDLHSLMDDVVRSATVDVDRLVSGGVERGRRRLRRRRVGAGAVGGLAAAVVAATVVTLAVSGGSSRAVDPIHDGPSGPVTATDGAADRASLALDGRQYFAPLDDLLPGDADVDEAAATMSGPEPIPGPHAPQRAPGYQGVHLSSTWAGARLNFAIQRLVIRGPGPEDFSYDHDPQARCLHDAEGLLVDPSAADVCRQLPGGLWFTGATTVAGDPGPGAATFVTVYTPDGWQIDVAAGSAQRGEQPTLTEQQALDIAVDPVWFSADPPTGTPDQPLTGTSEPQTVTTSR